MLLVPGGPSGAQTTSCFALNPIAIALVGEAQGDYPIAIALEGYANTHRNWSYSR